jgi:hypothetical protein
MNPNQNISRGIGFQLRNASSTALGTQRGAIKDEAKQQERAMNKNCINGVAR